MGRRGRPPYPDILTPREWEVLALLRQNLTNEAIAARLGVTHAAAKYHVSEILSKLGVASREEAAAWEPAREPAEAGKPRLRWGGWALVGWLRPVTVGKGALIGASVAVVAGLGVLAWGVLRESGEGEPAAATSSPPATGFPTTTSAPDASAPDSPPLAAPPFTRQAGTLIFARGWSSFDDLGAIWSANPDGSEARLVSEAHHVAAPAGVAPDPTSGDLTLYFLTQAGQEAEIWALDLVTGAELRMLSFRASEFGLGASVSPDGTRIAYMYRGGIAWLDILSGAIRHVVGGGEDEVCAAFHGLYDCASFEHPRWSADSRHLAVIQAFGEHGRLVVLDTASDPVTEASRLEVCCWSDWAPTAAKLCTWGRYILPSALYIASAPGWQASKFFSEYEIDDVSLADNGPAVTGCKWLDDETVLVRVIRSLPDAGSEVDIDVLELNVLDGSTRTVAGYRDSGAMWMDELPVIGSSILLQHRYATSGHRAPELLNTETGERLPLLTSDDTVIAVITPE